MLLAVGLAALLARPAAAEPTKAVRPLLDAHCGRCHGDKKQSGDVDLSAIQDDLSARKARKLLARAAAQVESGAMPPKNAKAIPPADRDRLLAWLRDVTRPSAGSADERDPGPGGVRRLTVAEYDNTVRDLLGVEFRSTDEVGMTDTPPGDAAFTNLAAALDVPPALLEKYFTAADKILDRFFGTELRSNVDGRVTERARAARERLFGLKPGAWRDPAKTVVKPPEGVGEREAAQKIVAGFLRRAFRRPVTAAEVGRMMAVYDKAAARGAGYVNSVRLVLKATLVSPHFLFRIEAPRPGEGSDHAVRVNDQELAVRLSYFLWSTMPDEYLMQLADRGQLTRAGPGTEPTRLFGRVIGTPQMNHWENPPASALDGDPDTFYDGKDPDASWVGLDLGEPRELKQIRYVPRPGQGNRMVGGRFQASNRADFSSGVTDLFTVARPPADGQYATQPVTAAGKFRYVRYLSPKGGYGNVAEAEFWGLLPGTVLEQQVRRMLADPKARALTDEFATQWLQLRKLPNARPSTEFFPEFSPDVRKAMYDEAAAFFDNLRQENRDVRELLDADYTFVNEELAKYYGIPGVKGKGMQRVELKPAYHRGGLFGMGGVLALTSHTHRTSPTLRGKYVLEVLFGTAPPPPPPDVGMIKDDGNKKDPKTFREKLAQHASQASCANCHRRMDPLGFALDNYNAAGAWREKDGDRPLDASGELPTGEKFSGVVGLKQILRARQADFARNLTEQLLAYALGRGLEYYDDGPVHEIQGTLEKGGHRLGTLVLGVVQSYPFLHRRGTDHPEEKSAE